MAIIFYNAAATVRKAELEMAVSTRLHQSLNGECTLDVTMPGKRLQGIELGDHVRYGMLYFTVNRIQRSSQTAGAMFSVSCEHISYLLADMDMPEGTYSGSVSSVLATIVQNTPLSVGYVGVSGNYEIIVKSGTNRREVLQQWASITGAEIDYTYYQVNFRAHVGSSTTVELSEVENVKSLTVRLDRQSDTESYSIELSRLKTLNLGDDVHIEYATLEVDVTTRILTLDYDIFHPMEVSIQCGDYIPTFYNALQDELDDLEEVVEEVVEEAIETLPEQIDERLELALVRAKQMDFSDWDNGSFFEILDNDVTVSYDVEFDLSGRPILITDGDHECIIVW